MLKWLSVALVLLAGGCGSADESANVSSSSTGREKLSVYVVNYPLQYFAERVGGEQIEAHFPAPSDVDPAYWNPGAEIVAAFQRADLILLNGASYAKWTERVALPASKLVDTSTSIEDRYIIIAGAVVHSHGPEGEHSHGETAFTTWLDPMLAVEQAKTVRDALIEARPDARSAFEAGFHSLEADLLSLDERIESAVAEDSDKPLVGSHPVYQYLARRYRLNLKAVHFEPDAYPGSEGWHDLKHLLDEHPAKWMLWESTPLRETEAKLRELGLESVVYDPCANVPSAGDFLSVMRENAAALEQVFSNE